MPIWIYRFVSALTYLNNHLISRQQFAVGKGIFEQCTSTGSRLSAFLGCGFAQIYRQIVSVIVKTLTIICGNANLEVSRHMLRGKAPEVWLLSISRSKNAYAEAPYCLIRKACFTLHEALYRTYLFAYTVSKVVEYNKQNP